MTTPDGALQPERWHPVVGYEGLYEVSDQGRVRTVARTMVYRDGRKRRIECHDLTRHIHRGYPQVHLRKHNRAHTKSVHQLVCRAFNGEPESSHEVRHLNDVKADNRAENLAWGTKTDNMHDRVRNGIHPMARKVRCKHGHLFDETNTRRVKAGRGRRCLACKRLSDAGYRARKRLA